MTIFEKLLVVHLAADWILGQTDWEGVNKKTNWLACISHGFKWTIAMLLGAFFWVGAPVTWLTIGLVIAMGILHTLIDRRKIPVLILRYKEYLPIGYPMKAPDVWHRGFEYPIWLVICIDQVLHVLQVAFLAAMFE